MGSLSAGGKENIYPNEVFYHQDMLPEMMQPPWSWLRSGKQLRNCILEQVLPLCLVFSWFWSAKLPAFHKSSFEPIKSWLYFLYALFALLPSLGVLQVYQTFLSVAAFLSHCCSFKCFTESIQVCCVSFALVASWNSRNLPYCSQLASCPLVYGLSCCIPLLCLPPCCWWCFPIECVQEPHVWR